VSVLWINELMQLLPLSIRADFKLLDLNLLTS